MKSKKVLIVDEGGFSRICAALLELQGCRSECHHLLSVADLRTQDVGLVVTSYPYGKEVLESLRKVELPVLILTDSISEPLLAAMQAVHQSYCMVKPLDYEKFTSYVHRILFSGTAE